MVDKQVDILIVGGGLTGAVLLLALADKGYSVLLVDANKFSDKIHADFDARSLALSPASVRILDMLNVWPLLQANATAINTIHVSDQHHFGTTRLTGKPDKPLGYVVEMQYINRALHQLLSLQEILAPAQLQFLDQQKGVVTASTSTGEFSIQAKLIVAADGTDSAVRRLLNIPARQKDYGQLAIVANIGLARAHHYWAYERFTASGPLALLPMTDNRASLVWALKPEEAQRLFHLNEKEFLTTLQRQFGYRLGRLVRVGKRVIFPLRQVVMTQQTPWPFVFVGNAAHTLHPVAGQGFNLGLRDVAALAQCILQYGLNPSMLQQYGGMRRQDQQSIINLTDGLIKIFTSRLPGLSLARNVGLVAVDNLPFLKNRLAYYARGFAGVTPDLVCGMALDSKEAT
ncbi:2-octaprenyl-6-methoxyphenyl hydroxylase [Legionella clemsonensis]|uniref:2-octaprenyl-6-methoxyphenol hydroxylase n=1 Tax=Legionella clemsonensis TaxID=1867846 RepID=A0A222P6E9_9GAMM|nr:2-octaprenyl-6-methoxyphenyl hydroxylase [Legionella clemsonensis]ASQ47440.1 2-octaprenyl-6-methoxyphenol hydroxylase [Legionella clemsonensis]